jgi:hypothetical protein
MFGNAEIGENRSSKKEDTEILEYGETGFKKEAVIKEFS